MTIDPTKPQNYRLRSGCEVVALFENPTSLLVIYRNGSGNLTSTPVFPDGQWMSNGEKYHLDLIPHDPVLRYWSVRDDGLVNETQDFASAAKWHNNGTVHRYAYHASGLVRPIPLDATTDPEAKP